MEPYFDSYKDERGAQRNALLEIPPTEAAALERILEIASDMFDFQGSDIPNLFPNDLIKEAQALHPIAEKYRQILKHGLLLSGQA